MPPSVVAPASYNGPGESEADPRSLWKKLSIRLPDSAHRRLKSKAALEGTTLQEIVENFVLDLLEQTVDQASDDVPGQESRRRR